jgi:transcriptional regulator with XRE-family HTH domain
MTLLDSTINALRTLPRDIPYAVIADEAGVSRQWLSQLVNDHIEDPGARKLQSVHDALKARGLIQ